MDGEVDWIGLGLGVVSCEMIRVLVANSRSFGKGSAGSAGTEAL